MSDIVMPSWRPSQEKPVVSGRMLAIAGGLLGVVALGAAATWGISRMGPRPVPVIEADSRPLKVRPEAPGGMVVPNQDQLVLEGAKQRRAAERGRTTVAQLDAGPEAPAFDLLREHVARPTPDPLASIAPPPAPATQPSSLGGTATTLAPPVAAPSLAQPVAGPGLAPPPLAATAPPGPVPDGRAFAQFGAVSSEEAARAEWERLRRRAPELSAFQPRITKLEREGQPTLWRLRATGLADGAAAKALCDAVRARNLPCVPGGA